MIFNYFETEKKLIYLQHGVEEIPQEIIAEFSEKDVTILDFSSNSLMSLDCISHFSMLKEVIFDNNFLSDSTIFPKKRFPKVVLLSLNNNKFEHLEQLLENLTICFPNLRYLSLLGNPLCPALLQDLNEIDYQAYRLAIIKKLPRLRFLDARSVDKSELLASMQFPVTRAQNGHIGHQAPVEISTPMRMERFGSIKKFFGFTVSSVAPALEAAMERAVPNPLPKDGPDSKSSSPKSAYGKVKTFYEGSQSQGNRFILNQDL